jgi:segregation and condensation protein B
VHANIENSTPAMPTEPVSPTTAASLAAAKSDPSEGVANAPATPPETLPDTADTLDLPMIKRVLEAALFAAGEPLATSELRQLFDNAIDAETIRRVLDEMRQDWHSGSVELTAVASGWRFRVRPEYQRYLDRLNPEKPPKYSRAVMETLAIIAYRQPVTRADIEQIRGVTVNAHSLKALEDRGWIQVLGQLDKPGRPSIYGTTKAFLNDLNLRSQAELPPLEELQLALDTTFGEAAEAIERVHEATPAAPMADVSVDDSQATTPDSAVPVEASADSNPDASFPVTERITTPPSSTA